MKTKQVKEEHDKNIDEETVIEPKTRARKKASDINEEDKSKPGQDEPKTSKDTKKPQPKPKAIVKKRPLGIRKVLRSKKPAVVKEKVKHVIKQVAKRGRKPAVKTEPGTQEKESAQLIPASEIKTEPIDDSTPNSRSSSPKTAGRRQRVSSDMALMKTMLNDTPTTLVLGPRTSPYSMLRKFPERSNSPAPFEGKHLRSGKPRKVKNLLNEVVKKEQKKRRRLLSDSKNPEAAEGEDCKKLKRGRSCSRDGSEISKCSDNTESDLSMSEMLNDSDSRELNKKLDKSKTDLDVDIENNIQISTFDKVPSLNIDSKLTEPKLDAETSSIINEKNKKLSLTRSTSLDSDNNNSNRVKLETLNTPEIEDKQLLKTETDTLFQARSSILTKMSETFNSKALAKNIRKARRGKKAAAEARMPTSKEAVKTTPPTITNDTIDDKHETIETLSKDIDDLIKNLDQNIDRDHEFVPDTLGPATIPEQIEAKSVSKFYGLNKPLSNVDDNTVITPVTPVKEREVVASIINEMTPSKNDDSENIRLHYEEDSAEKGDGHRHEITYKSSTVASIDKLMDRLKEFEEFDKRRQRQESESKASDNKPMMVTNDVVLITKSGADIKPLKDIQSVRSPERPFEKENVLSCFENNSAISIVKRDQVRKSVDIDLPNSVTLIKRKNSVSARKESTSSNHSRETDAISIFEKSLGKDVTLTEIRKSVDKSGTATLVDLHQFATLHPSNTSQIGGVKLDSSQISITPRVPETRISGNDVQIITKRKSRESLTSVSRKSSESTNEVEDKMATIEKIKSPTHQSPEISITATAVAIKSLETVPTEAEALPPPIENTKLVLDEIPVVASEVPKFEVISESKPEEKIEDSNKFENLTNNVIEENPTAPQVPKNMSTKVEKLMDKVFEDTPTSQIPKSTNVEKVIEEKPTTLEVPENKSTEGDKLINKVTDEKPTTLQFPKNKGSKVEKLDKPIEDKPATVKIQKNKITKVEKLIEKVNEEKPATPQVQKNKVTPVEKRIDNVIEEKPSTNSEMTGIHVTEKMEVEEIVRNEEAVEPKPQTMATEVEVKQSVKELTEEIKELVKEVAEEVKEEGPITQKDEDLTKQKDEDPTKQKDEMKEVQSKIESKPTESKPEEVPPKPAKCPGRPPKSARNSIESQAGPSTALNETPESQRRKENILRTLGLLTHKAAKEAKIEKLREKERIRSGMLSNKGKGPKTSGDYTGTLKTVIKLNRTGVEREKKKHNRSSLKMTFQKSKYRSGKGITEVGEAANEDTFYTIEKREAAGASATDGGQRKSYYSNRLNNHEPEELPEPTEPAPNLVIPEKASSFSIHPGRLCQDQCFYCGGKFGLFDTPCHIAQIKSSERQKKVLDNEEKLTIDSCLCDACYRHVDRRANCPSYRKRPLPKLDAPLLPPPPPALNQTEKPTSPPLEDESEEEPGPPVVTGRVSTCHTEGCMVAADHSIRRKWLIKMRSSVNKVLKLKCDYPGLHTIPLCAEHYRALSPLMACVLCRRRLTKHHNVHFIHHGYTELNPVLAAAGLPVQFTERPVLCKACRYYCTLLQRPHHNPAYAQHYHRKLLLIYNIELPPEQESENIDVPALEDALNKSKKKQRNKSKQRKSTEPESNSSETSEKTNESTPEKNEKDGDSDNKQAPIEEDIESLISSNKILVPGAVKTSETTPSDGSENEGVFDFDVPMIPVDKQTELQYLLQKQNNPAQFMHGQPNLTQKQKNFLKLQTVSAIQKPGQLQRISEKNAKRIQKLGLMMSKEKIHRKEDMEIFEEKSKDGIPIMRNITLNDECTIESIPNKRPADINTLKNKWQMSDSFTQVKRNLSELSKKLDKEPKTSKASEVKYSNPVKRLETNPSISVRELFPGEEEMNLQCNIEFNNVKGVTPEGWEKCNTMIQYDTETKRLWNELQRPYGNQSSFLRHLILLEKYFRSGDLVLSHNASPPAANYSDSVQSRLRAYDNVVTDAPRRSEPAISLIEFRKKPSINGKSLLKSNQAEDPKKFMPPPSGAPKSKGKDKMKSKQLPPELIAINTPNAQGRKAIQNVLHNIQQLVKGVSASDPTEVAAAPLPPPKFDPPPPPAPKLEPPPPPPPPPSAPPKEKKDTHKSDTPKKSKTSSKPWRPTLMPITQENLVRISREPTQVAVDGRTLPSLVQVMSSGKRYHITLTDYNKMCIMRREKLQQLHDGDKKRPGEDNSIVTELQPSTMLGNGGTVTQVSSDEKSQENSDHITPQIGANAVNILKNVGLKNITIAPISTNPMKTSTITSQTFSMPVISSPSLIVTSTPIKIPQLSSSVSITSETVLTPNMPLMTSQMIMPKIPKSLTVIPQTVMTSLPQNVLLTSASPQVLQGADPRP